MTEPCVLTPCRRCGVLPGWDKHVATADHPFDGDSPPAAPSGPWPCCRHCHWMSGPPCDIANRHAYPCGECHQVESAGGTPKTATQ